jgi:F0F1-type ATP synthase delta subunit
VLKKNRDLSLAKKIFGEFEKKYSEENGIFDGEISFARHADTKLKNSIEKKIVERGLVGKKIKELRLREVVDKGLIGGFKLRVGGMLMDASIKRALNKINDELSIVN